MIHIRTDHHHSVTLSSVAGKQGFPVNGFHGKGSLALFLGAANGRLRMAQFDYSAFAKKYSAKTKTIKACGKGTF